MRSKARSPTSSRSSAAVDQITVEQATRWLNDPVSFAREVFGLEIWSRQSDIMRAVAEHNRVAVRSGHKISKTLSLAILAWWLALTHPNSWVIITAPTDRQIRKAAWPEVRWLWRRALKRGIPLGPAPAVSPSKGVQFGEKWGIFGFTANDPESFAGPSGAQIFFLVDEASGVAEPMFEAMVGTLAGGGKLVMFGNPTQTSGTFFDAFHSKRDGWHCIHVASTEGPNFSGGSIKGLATPAWRDAVEKEYGLDSAVYAVRVLGEFPLNMSNGVVTLALLDKAIKAWPYNVDEDDRTLELGVDVARFGDDDTTICPRRGYRTYPIRTFHGLDTTQVADKVIEIARELRLNRDEIVRVKVDTCGIGAGVYDILRKHVDTVEAISVNAAEAADDEELYANMRSQLHFAVALWISEGGGIAPDDKKLEGELVAATYTLDARARRKVESKDEIKKRLKRSPDRADCLALAIYSPRTSKAYGGDIPRPHTRDLDREALGL